MSAFVSDTATSIVVYSPRATAAGAVDVKVTTALGGASQTTSADKFTYVAAPVITAIKPAAGPVAGGTRVTITGKNLADATVTFGTIVVTILSDTAKYIVVETPAGTAGPVNVTVTTVGGAASVRNAFTYQATTAAAVANNGPLVPGVNDLALLDLMGLSSPDATHERKTGANLAALLFE
jgi:hypothetical protein